MDWWEQDYKVKVDSKITKFEPKRVHESQGSQGLEEVDT